MFNTQRQRARRLVTASTIAAVTAGPLMAGRPTAALSAAPARPDVAAARAAVLAQLEPQARDLEAHYARLAQDVRDMPRDGFDPTAIVEQVGRDPDALVAWVRDHTDPLPYRGALKGPAGVLLDGGGNSLDRSLLLAALLRQVGCPVRLANATLSPAAAAKVLATFPGGRPHRPMAARSAVMSANIDRARKLSARVLAAVGSRRAAGVEAEGPAAAVADHWWVQRQTDDGAWADVDLSSISPAVVAARTVPLGADVLASVPAADCHAVVVRAVIERWSGGKLATEPVLAETLRPADVVGQPVSLTHFAGTTLPVASADDESDAAQRAFRSALVKQQVWVPVLRVGSRTVSRSAFHTDGSVDQDAQADPTGRLAGATGKAMGGTFGGLLGGDGDKAGPAGVLTAEWLEFEIRAPGRPPRVVRRPVFDLLGPAARAAGGSAAAPKVDDAAAVARGGRLVGTTHILIQPCDLTDAYLTYQLSDGYLRSRDVWLRVFRGDWQTGADVSRLLAAGSRSLNPILPAGAIRGDLLPDAATGTFIDRANVVDRRLWLEESAADHKSRWVTGVDLASTDVGAAAGDGGGDGGFAARVARGVSDTMAEQLALGPTADPNENTATLTERAAAAGRPLRVVRVAADLDALRLPPDARARAAADLAAGNVLAVVAGADAARAGWWRVDARTGQTVGVMDSGYNQTKAEAAVTDTITTFNNLSASEAITMSTEAIMLKAGVTAITGTGYAVADAAIATGVVTIKLFVARYSSAA